MSHKRSREKIIQRRIDQGARRKAAQEQLLNAHRNDGKGILDTTAFIAVADIVTKGKYLDLAKGFIIGREPQLAIKVKRSKI